MNVIVIGSGFGGLTAAIRLQAQGHQVTMLEKRDKPGGRAYVYEQDGFTFDGGPTIITAPWLIHDLFELCGQIHLNREVSEIVINEQSKQAEGVRTRDGEFFSAHIVVSNADVAFTYMQLIPERFRQTNSDRKLKNMQYSMSLFVLYFGTDRKYENMAHHEILMGPRYRGLLDDIFKHKVLAKDFSLYLHRPTATDPSLAPAGHDAWYVLSPVPHLGSGTDWTTTARSYRDSIIQYLEEHYMPDLSKHIVTEHYIDPLHFRDELNSYLGSAFSVEPILTQSAWFRPHNISEDIANLYFAGAGTHPGAGLPGVISSGKIVADMIGSITSNQKMQPLTSASKEI